MPDGIPARIRIYDNGGGNLLFHRPTCEFFDERDFPGWETGPVYHPQTGKRLIVVPDRGTFDRYTVVYPRRGALSTFYRGMSGPPYGPRHPQGFGQAGEFERRHADIPEGRWSVAMGGENAWGARRIPWERLPADCQEVVIEDCKVVWGLD